MMMLMTRGMNDDDEGGMWGLHKRRDLKPDTGPTCVDSWFVVVECHTISIVPPFRTCASPGVVMHHRLPTPHCYPPHSTARRSRLACDNWHRPTTFGTTQWRDKPSWNHDDFDSSRHHSTENDASWDADPYNTEYEISWNIVHISTNVVASVTRFVVVPEECGSDRHIGCGVSWEVSTEWTVLLHDAEYLSKKTRDIR